MSKPYGYAGIASGAVFAVGRSAPSMLRSLDPDDPPLLDTIVPCTRRAYDAVVGCFRMKGTQSVLVSGTIRIVDGTLDLPRKPGRPAKAPGASRTRTYGVTVTADVHARVMALTALQRAALGVKVAKAVERALKIAER